MPNPIEDALYTALDIINYPVSDTQKYSSIAVLFYQKACELWTFDNENRWRKLNHQPEIPMEPPIDLQQAELFKQCHLLCSRKEHRGAIPQAVYDHPIQRYKEIKAILWLSHLAPPFDPSFYEKGKRASFKSPAELTIDEIVEKIEIPKETT